MDNIQSTIYIDEAGDLGANRGTQWFVLTAVIVNNVDEFKIRKTVQSIKQRLNLKVIHFRNIKDFNRRAFIVRELSQENFQIVNVMFDTRKFDRSKMQSEQAYNFICRMLLERVSWLLRDTGRIGKIVLSSRGTARDGELSEYIQTKLIPYPENQIAKVFSGVECKPSTSWDMLQLADVCATSMFYSHEVNGYGFTVPCYAIKLSSKLYRYNNQLMKYGIKYFDDSMTPQYDLLKAMRACK